MVTGLLRRRSPGTGRGRRTVLAGLLAAALVGGTVAASSAAPGPEVRILQLNLCSSGAAGCYTGRAVAEAAAAVRAEVPDLVTLNEVCEDDVTAVRDVLAAAVPGGRVVSAFQPARDARSGDAYRCRSGRPYGIGVVSRWPAVPGSAPVGGIHPAQDRADPEQRAWLCLDVAGVAEGAAVTVCTTHLAYTVREIAVAQCRYLFGTVAAGLRARDGAPPLVVGADLNLGSADTSELRSCVPPGSALAGDGGQQHVVATPDLAVRSVRTVDLRGATDHAGLLVTLVSAGG